MKMKRVLDFTVAWLALVILSPVFLIMAILIHFTSSGPVFYRARRVGLNGRLFTLYKFRSMVDGADRVGAGITVRADPRITRIGWFLRRTKLDELPQLFNVLKGDMSLVGPRPEDPRYVADYTPEQRRVLSARPGITSWASIQYRYEEEMLDVTTVDDVYRQVILPQKLALDLQYLERQSLQLDVRILFRTLFALLGWYPPPT